MMAKPAIAIDAANPGNAGTRSKRQIGCRAVNNFAHDLMPRNELRPNCRQILFDDMQVSATNPAGNYPKQDISGPNLRAWNILDLKKQTGCMLLRFRASRIKDGSLHFRSSYDN
jgi:hypothetical protein